MKPRTLRRKLRREAALLLLLARVAVRLLPAERLLAWAARPPAHLRRFADPNLPAFVAATVDHVANTWTGGACMPRALAVQFMLRRRGIASRLCLGVARNGEVLAAHAWVETDEGPVIGETEQRFARVAELG